MTLSAVATLIVEVFLPETYQKYLFINYKQSSEYCSYKSFVSNFLHGQPRSVIISCMERQSKSLKYTEEDVCLINAMRPRTARLMIVMANLVLEDPMVVTTTQYCLVLAQMKQVHPVHVEIGHNGTFLANTFGQCFDSIPLGTGINYLKIIRRVLTSVQILMLWILSLTSHHY